MYTKIAIVGRPNVGKSALFNKICKKRIAIVDEAEGITRDRLYSEAELFGRPFQLIDTGGLDSDVSTKFQENIKNQVEKAILEADGIIMVVDGRVGMTELDFYVSRILHKTKKPVALAVNKIDNSDQEELIHQFHKLGMGEITPISALHGHNIAELLESILNPIKISEIVEEKASNIQIGIIGRPNVGKSTLVNFLLKEERCVTDPVAGTTRDHIDVIIEHEGENYTLIDTAGIRRKRAEHETVDKFASIRTKEAIDRSDLCVLMLDATKGMTSQDKKIADQIEEAGKGCLILFNKWDLVKGFRMEHCLKDLRNKAPFTEHCPVLFASAKEGRNIDKLFPTINEIYEQFTRRITTHQLNTFIERAMQRNHPPRIMGKRLRIYYMTQVRASPPRFMLFVNYSDRMTDNYKKYLLNQFRNVYGFKGVPLILHLKNKVKNRFKEKGSC